MGKMRLEIGGKAYEVEVSEPEQGFIRVAVDGTTYDVRIPEGGTTPAAAARGPEEGPGNAEDPASSSTIVAPIPGSVVEIPVREGARVVEGQTLLVLESMKMNVPVRSPRGGTVRRILVKVGESVHVSQPLMEVS